MVLRRYAVLAATRALRRIRPNAGSVLFLTKTLCVKHGQLVALSEASTLRFVAKHTSIPAPKVQSAFVHNGSTYILMDRIDGKMLTCRWSSRSAESKTKILTQLKRMADEVRSLPPPSQRISDVNGGPGRFPRSSFAWPFNTIHDFHFYLRGSRPYPRERQDDFVAGSTLANASIHSR